MKQTTRNLILSSHRYSYSYKNGLSNHLPMALFALEKMGGSDEKLKKFFDFYCQKLEPNNSKISINDDPSNYLSRSEMFLGIAKYLESELKTYGVQTVLNKYIHLLSPGISGGALHPLIRLAYALEGECLPEISHALASWFTSYQELYRSNEGNESLSLEDSLKSLSETSFFQNYELDGYSIFRRVKSISDNKEFHSFYSLFEINDNSLSQMSDICLRLYLSTDDDFTALHAVTSCHALRVLSEYIDDCKFLYRFYWQAIGAFYIEMNMPQIIDSEITGFNLPSWEALFEKSLLSSNDHLIKFVYSCKKEFEYWKNPLFHYAATLKSGLIHGKND